MQKTAICSGHYSAISRNLSFKSQISSATSSSHRCIPYPKEITSYLDQFVIGQEYAKKTLAVGIYQHYKRFSYNATLKHRKSQIQSSCVHVIQKQIPGLSSMDKSSTENIMLRKILQESNGRQKHQSKTNFNKNLVQTSMEIDKANSNLDKSNIILMGPSGVGKTYLTQILAKILDVPIAMCDCTLLTQSGYVGDDVDTVIQKLLVNADGDIDAAQRGIVFLDEFDKISSSLDFESRSFRDVGGRGVQQAFLKLVEGTVVKVKLPGCNGIQADVDTTNILFIASGAFHNLDRIVSRRLHKKLVGFGAGKNEELCCDYLTEKVWYGTRIGRTFPRACTVYQPDGRVTHSNNERAKIFDRFTSQKQFLLDDIQLCFTDCALKEIARIAIRKGTGARALRSIIEKVLLDAKYDLPGTDIHKLVIDASVVKSNSRYYTLENANIVNSKVPKQSLITIK
ncbi:ATP-dependent Clp protease ATP-binding subunit clpX-like, mitochondrial [Dirofilaria immitis]|nr:ATP-dependent Clp protease ATP-binding subunit clpX-like, mitochondrial [Dirofilaria immitis]